MVELPTDPKALEMALIEYHVPMSLVDDLKANWPPVRLVHKLIQFAASQDELIRQLQQMVFDEKKKRDHLQEFIDAHNFVAKEEYDRVKKENTALAAHRLDLVTRHTDSITDLHVKLREANSNLQNSSKDLADQNAELELKTSEIEALRADKQKLESEKANYDNKIESLRKDNDDLRAKCEAMKKDCDNYRECQAECKKYHEHLKRKISDKEAKCEELGTKLQAFETALASKQSRASSPVTVFDKTVSHNETQTEDWESGPKNKQPRLEERAGLATSEAVWDPQTGQVNGSAVFNLFQAFQIEILEKENASLKGKVEGMKSKSDTFTRHLVGIKDEISKHAEFLKRPPYLIVDERKFIADLLKNVRTLCDGQQNAEPLNC